MAVFRSRFEATRNWIVVTNRAMIGRHGGDAVVQRRQERGTRVTDTMCGTQSSASA